MALIGELLVAAMILVGAFFALVGSYGLVKLPDLMSRLHAPTKASTLGVGGIVVGSMLDYLFFHEGYSLHEVLITAFIFLTAPVSAFMLAKSQILRSPLTRAQLTPTGRRAGWATLDDPPEDEQAR